MVPKVLILTDPILGAAPIVLYEIVLVAAPSKFSVANAPIPVVLKYNLLVVEALIVILAVPSNATALIVLGVANAVAVDALPVVLEALSGISAAAKARY